MNRSILATATLFALTIVGRTVLQTDDLSNGKTTALTPISQPIATEPVVKTLPNTTFAESGGEFLLKLFLRRQGNEWTIVKTDEVTTAEWKERGYLSAFKDGYAEPDPSTWVILMSPVREYLYYRKQAVINQNVSKLWERYPDLKQANPQSGINAEASVVANYRTFKLVDGNIQAEHYERLKAKVSGDRAEVIIHGMETYLSRRGGK